MPWHVDFIINHPWAWKLAAGGHLATQFLPILAIFSLNRPYVRLFEGMVFAAGVFFLKAVMGFWNPPWIILAGFFVDWEFFLRKLGLLLKQPAAAASTRGLSRWFVMAFSAWFVLTNLVIIATRFDDTGLNRFYPFSSMNFYSNVAATKPYGQHMHYSFTYAELIFNYRDGTRHKWSCYPSIASSYVMAYGNGDLDPKLAQQVDAMKAVLGTIAAANGDIADCTGVVRPKEAESIDLYSSVLQIPAYPKPARFDLGHRALVSRFEVDSGRILAASAQLVYKPPNLSRLEINVASEGLDVARYAILLANDPWKNEDIGPLIPVPGEWNGSTLAVDADFLGKLASSQYPVVVRVVERSGRAYDFFGGMLYK
jgi:hypothetical protein